jgi:ArsR family transcriptional regulator
MNETKKIYRRTINILKYDHIFAYKYLRMNKTTANLEASSNIPLEKMASILKTMAHPVRILILKLLKKRKQMSVNDICDALELEQSLTSHHLNLMKMNGILKSNKDGRQTIYYVSLPEVLKVIGCMENCDKESFFL